MHALIDDFAWIAIALVVVTLLFMVGAAVILLDEGLRAIVRAFRKRAAAPSVSSVMTNLSSVSTDLRREAECALKWITAPVGNSLRAAIPAIWHTERPKALAAKPERPLRLHAGHHKS